MTICLFNGYNFMWSQTTHTKGVAMNGLIQRRSVKVLLLVLLVLAITAAIFMYFNLFDFSTHPGQLIYVGAYFLIGIPLTLTIIREGTGLRQA